MREEMRTVLLLVLLSHFAFSVKHSLKLICVASSGVPGFTEFSAAAEVDGTRVAHCDTPYHASDEWMQIVFDNNPQHLQRYIQESLENQAYHFRSDLHNLMQRFNQSEVVILQRVSGCELDDESGKVIGFNKYAYNGEDLLSLDLNMSTWIAARQQTINTKLRLNTDHGRKNLNMFYLTQLFPGWLNMYIHHEKNTLMRTVLPSVSLLQKSPSSPVSCHATGFFPDRAVMFWRRDGVKLSKNVDHGEILPNHDGSFQMSVDLLKTEDWRRYECVFQLSGVKEDQVYKLHKDMIRTNHEDPTDVTVFVGVGLFILLLVAAVVGSVFYRQRKATKTRTEDPETLNPETTSMNTPSCTQPDQDHHNQEEETLNTEPLS